MSPNHYLYCSPSCSTRRGPSRLIRNKRRINYFPNHILPLMSLNTRYLECLAQYPLLTKSVTAGILAAINELVASGASGEYQQTTISAFGKSRTLKHVFSRKTVQMVVYGGLVATPLSHYLYNVLNRVFKGKLGPVMKAVQILVSLCTVSPTLSAAFVSWVSLINNYHPKSSNVALEARRVFHIVSSGLKQNFWRVYRGSAQTSMVAIAIAQAFLPLELWVVFFTVVFFVLGTIQNTRFKVSQRAQRQEFDT